MSCRMCGSTDITQFLSLGEMPLVNNFLRREQLQEPEPGHPLDVYLCTNCHLVQLVDVVPPEVMFRTYVYYTASSAPLKTHFTELAQEVLKYVSLPDEALIVDIGGNDGTLLANFHYLGFRTLNVEPAIDQAHMAEARGIASINEFFSNQLAEMIVRKEGCAKVIFMTNVFAHVNDLHDLLLGVKTLLDADGLFVIEVPYLVDLLEKKEFDTIYHEHLSYISLRPLLTFFRKHGLDVVQVKRLSVHGGSIRVYARKAPKPLVVADSVTRLIELEKAKNLDAVETYIQFAKEIEGIRHRLRRLLRDLKNKKQRIVGYTAPAKGNVLLNYCKIGTDVLDYLTDTTPAKQGLCSPGMHIPVVPPERLKKDKPDYLLLLAWNYQAAILRKEAEYLKQGGKFIIPIPHPHIVSAEQ